MILTAKNIQATPNDFTPKQLKPYPPDNNIPFEEWFFKNYDPDRNASDRIYLPVQWTAFYCNHKHGRDKSAMRSLQNWLNNLDRSKKYFTVIQYDDGILNNVSHLDLKVCGLGCEGDIQLPLVCQPHKYDFKESGRPIFASFIGAITHPIRQRLVQELDGKEGYFISTENTGLHSYCYIMSLSKYVLCPRGYGKTSFRIQEALQYGATPIYISDEFLYNNDCSLELHESRLGELENIIIGNSQLRFINNCNPDGNKRLFERFFTFPAVANMIYENL